eukprot:m.126007 g.126007  ORF g.126007 m.126007 type:complete len:1242 (-) comp9701_c0_seq1:1386-5111(-)
MEGASAIERAMPGAPNWFLSAGCDCNRFTGLFFYGASNRICILDTRSEQLDATRSLPGHRPSSRVTVVQCSPHPQQTDLVVSSGTDGGVCLWDAQTSTILKHHSRHKGEPSACSWSPLNMSLIVSGDSKGSIVCWYFAEDRTDVFQPLPGGSVSAICCSPLHEDQLCVGYADGSLLITAVASGEATILHRLRVHEQTIQSLAWNADAGLLACGSKDRTISVWSAASWTQHTHLTLKRPPKRGGSASGNDRSDRDRIFLAVAWLSEDRLVSTSYGGNLLLWSIGEGAQPQAQAFTSRGHNHATFAICPANVERSSLVSISSDRAIVGWDPASLRFLWQIPTIGGHIYSIDSFPKDPGTLVFGAGDDVLRVWRTQASQPYDCRIIWKGMQSRVCQVKCHPDLEDVVAYGKGDGHVGVYKIFKKSSVLAKASHPDAVRGLAWHYLANGELVLCSIGSSGQLLIHSGFPEAPVSQIGDEVLHSTGEVWTAICSSSSCTENARLALGAESGHVYVFNGAWEAEATFDCFTSSVSAMDMLASEALSLVCGSITGALVVCKEQVRALKGHSQQICSISISPHNHELFVVGCHDHAAQVWNMVTDEPVASFRGHSGRVLTVHWSHQADLIVSGSTDQTLCVWDPSKQPLSAPPQGKRRPRRKKAAAAESPAAAAAPVSLATPVSVGQDDGGPAAVPVSHLSAETTVIATTTSRSAPHKAGQSQYESLGSTTSVESLPSVTSARALQGVTEFLGIKSLPSLAAQARQNSATGNFNHALQAAVWDGNLVDVLNTAIETKALTPSHVALSIAAGREVWQLVAVSYAQQLEENEDWQMAATYYLSCFQLHEAVAALTRGGLFRDAAQLADSRLDPADPAKGDLLEAVAREAESRNQLTFAAKCFIGASKPEEALRILQGLESETFLYTALGIADACAVSSKGIERKILVSAIAKRTYEVARKALMRRPGCEVLCVTLFVAEFLGHGVRAVGMTAPQSMWESMSGVWAPSAVFVKQLEAAVSLETISRLTNSEVLNDWKRKLAARSELFSDVCERVSCAMMLLLAEQSVEAVAMVLESCQWLYDHALFGELSALAALFGAVIGLREQLYPLHDASPGWSNAVDSLQAFLTFGLLVRAWWTRAALPHPEVLTGIRSLLLSPPHALRIRLLAQGMGPAVEVYACASAFEQHFSDDKSHVTSWPRPDPFLCCFVLLRLSDVASGFFRDTLSWARANACNDEHRKAIARFRDISLTTS